MKIRIALILICLFGQFSVTNNLNAQKKVKVVTTITVLADLVKQAGGDRVEVESIARGNQDPHFVEILPSYMMKVRKADVFVKIGLELELWAQQVIDGSRNSKLKIIDCSIDIEKAEVPAGKIDASYGDVHKYGNPHYWLDPENAEHILNAILNGLAEVSPDNFDYFASNVASYLENLNKKTAEWTEKMSPYRGAQVIFYHNQWPYFCDRFGLKAANFLEPKPGIKPSASHVAKLIKQIKDGNIPLIITSPFYEDRNPKLLERSTNAKLLVLPTSIIPKMGVNTYIELFDFLVNNISESLSGNNLR
jgi:ABC-type Zn uptake system ZnuABC Zn-binding protein ZnuA